MPEVLTYTVSVSSCHQLFILCFISLNYEETTAIFKIIFLESLKGWRENTYVVDAFSGLMYKILKS